MASKYVKVQVGDCQNYSPFLGPYHNTGPNLGDSKRDHNFDNPPSLLGFRNKWLRGGRFINLTTGRAHVSSAQLVVHSNA